MTYILAISVGLLVPASPPQTAPPPSTAVAAEQASVSTQPETWVPCPTHIMRTGRHRLIGPAELVPTWWTRPLVERVRSCLGCDAARLGDSPVVVELATNSMGRPERIVLEDFGGAGRTTREVSLGRAARLVNEPVHGRPSVAVLGDVLAVVARLGSSQYVAYLVDTKRMRLVRAIQLRLPELTWDGMTSGPPPAVAAGPDRFGIAIGHSDELVWLELDARGKERVPARVLTGVSTSAPSVVWNGERFAILVGRLRTSGIEGATVPEILTVSPDVSSIAPLASLSARPPDPSVRTWVVGGRLIFEDGAHFVAARTYASSETPSRVQFSLFRIDRDGRVFLRECQDIDEE